MHAQPSPPRFALFACLAPLLWAAGIAWGGNVLINFDVYSDRAPVQPGDVFTDQWADVGVVFSDGAGNGPGPAGNPCSYSPPNHAAASGLIIATFVDPCTGEPSPTDFAGTRQDWCWAPGEGIDMYAYDGDGNLLAHEFNSGGGTLVTFSFPAPVIARLDMYHIGQGIDDFVFNMPAAQPLPADVNEDCTVNIDDLFALIAAWGQCPALPELCPADVDGSGAIDIDDLFVVLAAWS